MEFPKYFQEVNVYAWIVAIASTIGCIAIRRRHWIPYIFSTVFGVAFGVVTFGMLSGVANYVLVSIGSILVGAQLFYMTKVVLRLVSKRWPQ